MRTFVVCHSVPLVAYLVAATLRIYFGRLVNIYIIERTFPNLNSNDSSVWCGVSTVSIGRIPHWKSLEHLLLGGILRDVLIQVDSIHIHEQSETQYKFSKPIINATESINGSVFGIFYHPRMVTDRLRQFLANSPNTFFLSSNSRDQSFLNHNALPSKFVLDLVWLDFEGSTERYQVGERLEQAPAPCSKFGTCSARILANSRRRVFANSYSEPLVIPDVLWLPMYRASAGVFGELIFTHERNISMSQSHFRIATSNSNSTQFGICLKNDLLWGIRACGYVIECLRELPESAPRL